MAKKRAQDGAVKSQPRPTVPSQTRNFGRSLVGGNFQNGAVLGNKNGLKKAEIQLPLRPKEESGSR